MPAYSGMTQAQLRERLHNERRVEFCFEDHRFFDVRRWKLFDENGSAAAEKSLPIYQQVYNLYTSQVNSDGVYSIISNTLHPQLGIVLPKSYLFPIPNSEFKMDPNLGQNSGWEITTTDSTTTSK
jgi:hypothetical protein